MSLERILGPQRRGEWWSYLVVFQWPKGVVSSFLQLQEKTEEVTKPCESKIYPRIFQNKKMKVHLTHTLGYNWPRLYKIEKPRCSVELKN